MFKTVIQLVLISLIPIGIATLINVLRTKTKFDEIKKPLRYTIIIALFSFSCIMGTVFGVQSEHGVIINVRDASPIIAGLMFGGPVGIAVGFIGGLYRFISVYWGGSGAYTQVACSISTFCAGIFTLFVRKYIFNNHHGRWYYGFFLGVLCEDFHMLLVILTHLSDTEKAYGIVTDVAGIMILVNALAIMTAILIADVLFHEKIIETGRPIKISTKIQWSLIITLVFAYGVVSSISYFSTKNVADKTTENLLKVNLEDLTNDVDSVVNQKFYEISINVRSSIEKHFDDAIDDAHLLDAIKNDLHSDLYDLSEINLVANDGKIAYSTVSTYIGFDMNSTDQSKEFNVLIDSDYTSDHFIQEMTEPGSADRVSALMKYAAIQLKNNARNLSYVQIGMDAEKYYSLLDSKIQTAANYRHIGNNGLLLITDSEGNPVSTLVDIVAPKIDIDKLQLNKKYVISGTNGDYDYKYYAYAKYIEGYYILAMADLEEQDLSSNIAFSTLTLTEVFAFLVLYCVLYIAIKRIVVDKIENVGKSLTAISSGDFTVKVHEYNSKEMKKLSEDINSTVDSLKEFAEKEQAKMAEELQFAKNIQHSALPTVFPLNNNFRIYANMITAKAVGGDFYDFYYIDRIHVAILIADVSGKGIPAAMFMMKSKTVLKGLVESGMPIHLAMTEANKKLCEGNDANMFVTAWLGLVNITDGHVEFVNAGHNPPLVQKEDGTFEYLNSKKGFVLAGIDGFKYEKQSFDLKPGEKIYLYTDGVTEATNESKQLYSEPRLLDVCNKYSDLIPRELCDEVVKSIDEFVGEAEQADDITMLCFQLTDQRKESSYVFEAKGENVTAVTEFVDKYLTEAGCSMKAEMQIDVAIDEIFSNICNYGYKDHDGKVRVTVTFDPNKENVSITFEDKGIPYNPLAKKDPNVEMSAEERQIGGLGIYIVKNTMDDAVYEFVNGHNMFKITKNIK